jgi:glycosyltransferase involved in cell wall biosynthesis
MFSVVIPIYNKAPHLERSIHSVLNQSFSEFELILVDDGSTDGSREKLNHFNDPRVKIYFRDMPGPGGYAARNLGIEKAVYPWISFLDADDNWEMDYLTNISQAINKFPESVIIASAWKVNSQGQEKKCPANNLYPTDSITRIDLKRFIENTLVNAPTIWTSVATIKKDCLQEVGMFPAGHCKAGGDVDAWLRLMLNFKGMVFINKILATYQTESVNMVTKSQKTFEVGCIIKTVKQELALVQDSDIRILLMKYSNKYLFALIAKSIRADQFNPTSIDWIYKESDLIKYLIVNLFKFKLVRFLYKLYLDKKEPFYG